MEALHSGRLWSGGRAFIVLAALLFSYLIPGGNLAGLLMLWVAALTASDDWRAALRELGFNFSGIKWGWIIFGTPGLFIASSLAQWLTRVGLESCGIEYKTQFLAEYFLTLSGWRLIWLTFSIVIIAPLLEELVFRRIIFGWLLKFIGATAAVLLTSLLFGLLHSVYQLPGLLILALGWQYVYIKSGNLANNVLMHALNNALTLILLLITG